MSGENHGTRASLVRRPSRGPVFLERSPRRREKKNGGKKGKAGDPRAIALLRCSRWPSRFRAARGRRPWQLLTFIRTPCRSLHVVSFGHRAARCIPMQITLAPGTRRNRRNFMLLRNATCHPVGPRPPLVQALWRPPPRPPALLHGVAADKTPSLPRAGHGGCAPIYYSS